MQTCSANRPVLRPTQWLSARRSARPTDHLATELAEENLRDQQKRLEVGMATTKDILLDGPIEIRLPAKTADRRSAELVAGRRHQYAGAAGLAPDAMIDGPGLRPDVVAGMELLVVDQQLAVQ
jgi:hypothetical protein